jgi:protein-disulfide isomerase
VICDKDWLQLNPSGGGIPLTPIAGREKLHSLFQAVRVEEAISVQYGTGSHKVILLTAYDCPKCRTLERNLDHLARQLDVTIYTFPMALNLQAPVPMQTATDLWCRDDAKATWHSVMLGRTKPPTVRGFETARCGLKVAQNTAALAAAFGVRTVPTVILDSGRIVFDAASMPLPALAHLLGS